MAVGFFYISNMCVRITYLFYCYGQELSNLNRYKTGV